MLTKSFSERIVRSRSGGSLSWRSRLFSGIIIVLEIFGGPQTAWAFGTGHHRDLTYNALLRSGWPDADALRAVAIANWLPDFYPEPKQVLRLADKIAVTDLGAAHIREAASLLHFDNLNDIDAVRSYWRTLEYNTRRAIRSACCQPDKQERLLFILGVTLHAVQDFYSHSTWVSDRSRSRESWRAFDASPGAGVPPGGPVYTGTYPAKGLRSHDWIHKDGYHRENWQQAYVLAYIASREWIESFRGWVIEATGGDPTAWILLSTYQPAQDDQVRASREFESSYLISTHLAKWKSEDIATFGDVLAHFLAFIGGSAEDSFLRRLAKESRGNVIRDLALGLDESRCRKGRCPAHLIPPARPDPVLNERLLVVRSTEVVPRMLKGEPDFVQARIRLTDPTSPHLAMTFDESIFAYRCTPVSRRQSVGSVTPGEPETATSRELVGCPWRTVWVIDNKTTDVIVNYRVMKARNEIKQMFDVGADPASDAWEGRVAVPAPTVQDPAAARVHTLGNDPTRRYEVTFYVSSEGMF